MSQAVIEQDWDLVASLAADLHDAHARLVDAVAVALVEGSWMAAGIRSPEHWLVVRAGLSRGHAAAVVLMARRAGELPATAAALRAGRISLDQAAVVARHAPAAFDVTVAEFAQHATVPQLQRSVARYDFTLEPRTFDEDGALLPAERDPDAKPEVVEPATLSMGVGEDGRFRLRYDAPAEVGALVRAALAEAKDALFHTVTDTTHTGEGDDAQHQHDPYTDPDAQPGPRRATWADALVLLATRSLDAGTTDTPARRARYRVQVHLDTDGGWLNAGPRLPQHVVDGLTCDGTLTPVWETEGSPVNVGRTHRVVPHRTRVLVLDRDRGCRFPGCPTRASDYLEVHHRVHWRDGGLTDLANLLCLCTFHHDSHHRGEFTITGDPTRTDGLVFETRQGWPIGPPSAELTNRPEPQALAIVDPAPDPGPISADRLTPEALSPPGPRRPPPRPTPRLGRTYPAPTGGTLHLHLVDLTPSRAAPRRE
ncbi:HNH endonuclease signature motif containing protein [Intrasporangium flavum]|uniref:HNH endonuclease signature motif containing protein n=1 Tax=Intrasporangium flavum TaxID=1428657 RepID=UPI00096D2492|nr:HNH endonuclease signature motif containing protein [Intrasporangium flavum]